MARVAVRVIHPGVDPDRYLIEVETARVFSLASNSFRKTKRPRWLFSSLYWPLPAHVGQVRCAGGKLTVTLPWQRSPPITMRANVGGTRFTVYGAPGGPVHCASPADAIRVKASIKSRTTEAVIAVSGPLCRVCMFLGVERSSVALLKAFTVPLIAASRCRTART